MVTNLNYKFKHNLNRNTNIRKIYKYYTAKASVVIIIIITILSWHKFSFLRPFNPLPTRRLTMQTKSDEQMWDLLYLILCSYFYFFHFVRDPQNRKIVQSSLSAITTRKRKRERERGRRTNSTTERTRDISRNPKTI